MPRIPDPNEDRLGRIERIVNRLLKGSPLESSSISNGLVQFIGGKLEGLAGAVLHWVGSVKFEGPFENIGAFLNRGPFTNKGTMRNEGKLEQVGDSELGGNVKITQSLEVTAETLLKALVTLLADMKVSTGGTITVEDGKIVVRGAVDMTIENGSVDFDNGGHISGDGDQVIITGGGAPKFTVSPSAIALIASLAASISISDAGNLVRGETEFADPVEFSDDVRMSVLPIAPPGSTPNLWRDPDDGRIYKIPS